MTQIGSSTPTYDANGNVTNDFLHTYAWDANGRPVTADGVGLTYDALGRMAEQNRSGVYTEIVYSPAGAKLALMTGQTLQKAFVPLTGSAVAVYNSSGLAYYRHSDWLGSSRFASTPTRSMYLDGAYAPFGESYAQTGTVDLSFTGMNQDTVSNLYDFPAREYGIQGRWPSPDPAGLVATDLTDPQTLNRYAYVRNSPVHFVDPQGLNLCEPAGCTGYGGGGGGDDGYCPPEYNYCGDDPFGDDGGGGILAGSPGSVSLPPNGINWQGLLFGPQNFLIQNWQGSACDPSVPDCGVTVNCPDDGSGPCTLSTTTTCGSGCAGGSDQGSGSSWWSIIFPWLKYGTYNVPGAGRPLAPSSPPELNPAPINQPPDLGPIGTDIPGTVGPGDPPFAPGTPKWMKVLYLLIKLLPRQGSIILITDPCAISSSRRLPGCPGPMAALPATQISDPRSESDSHRDSGQPMLPRQAEGE